MLKLVIAAALLATPAFAQSPVELTARHQPLEFGALVQYGNGITDDRNAFKFIMAGVHAGKVLTPEIGHSILKGQFEYAAEVFPLWQSYTPRFQRESCVAIPNSTAISCSAPYTVGGTFTGVSVVPVILRWNFTSGHRVMPWFQGSGGAVWTNHKYPAFGTLNPVNLQNDGPNADASVFNFVTGAGIGMHYFTNARHSFDFGASGVHLSSASLGDRNPGVNASIYGSIGYTWWHQ